MYREQMIGATQAGVSQPMTDIESAFSRQNEELDAIEKK